MTKRDPLPEPKNADNLVCSHCLQEKPKTEFYKTTNYYHKGRGYTYVCKTCSRASAKRSIDAKRKDDDGGCDETTTAEG